MRRGKESKGWVAIFLESSSLVAGTTGNYLYAEAEADC